jgi:hypothetical protein
MHFPDYWVKADGEAKSPEGRTVHYSVWRWSDVSEDEAKKLADEAAEKMAQRIQAGETFPDQYNYGERPVREEVIREERDQQGNLMMAITRNIYGAYILNSDRAMFIDIDLEQPQPGLNISLFSVLKRLFGKKDEVSEQQDNPEQEAINSLKKWVSVNPGWGFRVYRTYAGLRYLVTHQTFDPEAIEVEQVLDALDSDPNYKTLCRVQKSFRARLTPKPW